MITLTRQSVQLAADSSAARQTWPLKVTATVEDGSLVSPKIFIYHAARLTETSKEDIFEAVASVHTLSLYPEDVPKFVEGDDSLCIPYYRKDSIFWDCFSPDEAEQLWQDVQEDVTDLVAAIASRTNLHTEEVVEL